MNRAGILPGLLLVALATVCCGCQSKPNSAEVSGVVMLDGEPLAKAEVIFTPDEGRASFGITNEQGGYALIFTGTKKGAMPGTHRISITTAVVDFDGDGSPAREIVPAKYRGPESELIQEVKPGKNTIDFDLRTP